MCKVSGYALNNNNYNDNSHDDIKISNDLNKELYLSRLIKIISYPFINKIIGIYNYNKNNRYNFIDIINDYNIFLKNKFKYKQLLFIKKNLLEYYCNINKCQYINYIYRNNRLNINNNINTKYILISKIYMSFYHFDLCKKRYRINNNNIIFYLN